MMTDCRLAPYAITVAETPRPLLSVTAGTARPSGSLPKVERLACAASAGVATTQPSAASAPTPALIQFRALILFRSISVPLLSCQWLSRGKPLVWAMR